MDDPKRTPQPIQEATPEVSAESAATSAATALDATATHDGASQEQLRARLRRIEGQVRGITRMLESDRSCEDVVTQLMAVRASLDTVGALVLDAHLCNCVEGRDGDEQVRALRDAMRLWWRFAPSAGAMGAASDELGAASPLPDLGEN